MKELDIIPECYIDTNLVETKAFTDITKDVDSKKDPRFKHLFKDIQTAREMETLGNVLAYLRNHKYDYKESDLIAFF